MITTRDMFRKKLAIATVSALKKEVGQADEYLAMNIAKTPGGGVFTEGLLLMNDPTFVTSRERQARMQAMIQAQLESQRRFLETGEIPKTVLDNIKHAAAIDLDEYSPSGRALALMRRRQMLSIVDALRSGVDPRNIPALVNMIADHHISQAFTGEGLDTKVRIPDAFRFKIRPRGGLDKTLPVDIDQRSITTVAVRDPRVAVKDPSDNIKHLPLVNASFRGKEMVVADDIMSTYKAALGTFDMDDSALPMLHTYKDASGRERIAFVAMRDPKGFEESILIKPQLDTVDSLDALLLSDGSDAPLIKEQLRKAQQEDINRLIERVFSETQGTIDMPDVRSAVDITLEILRRPDSVKPASDTTRVLQDRLTSLRSTLIRYHGEEEGAEQFDVLTETVVRVLREGMYGQRLAEQTSKIAPISQRLIDILTERASSSVRGRDVLSSAAIEGRWNSRCANRHISQPEH